MTPLASRSDRSKLTPSAIRPKISDNLQTFLLSLLFLVGLLVWEYSFFNDNYFSVFERITTKGYEIWPINYILVLVFSNICSILITLGFVFISLRLSNPLKICCLILFGLAIFYQYGYFNALGRFVAAEDIIMLLLYASDPILIRDSILLYISWKALVPIAGYAVLLWKSASFSKIPSTWLFLLVSLAFLFYSFNYRTWYLAQYELPSTAFSSLLRSISFTPWKWINSYGLEREHVAPVSEQKPSDNIIFIVDESIRGDHLSINGYERQTTPFLQELERQGLLFNWGEAVSTATVSLPSNQLLLTGIHELPAAPGSLSRQASIFQYAQAMGYRTYYIDASNAIFWNGIADDLNYIDVWENTESFNAGALYDKDLLMAERVRQIVSESSGNFIWINKRGVHALYNNTFPEAEAEWQPIMQSPDHTPEHHAEIVNSYDNGIKYNVDGFFRVLLADQTLLDTTTILYTADHGQTLAEHGEAWTHGKDTPNEARVPLFLISKTSRQLDLAYKAHHTNIFPTLLDLIGYPKEKRLHSYALSLFEARASDSQPRPYYLGPLEGDGQLKRFVYEEELQKLSQSR